MSEYIRKNEAISLKSESQEQVPIVVCSRTRIYIWNRTTSQGLRNKYL